MIRTQVTHTLNLSLPLSSSSYSSSSSSSAASAAAASSHTLRQHRKHNRLSSGTSAAPPGSSSSSTEETRTGGSAPSEARTGGSAPSEARTGVSALSEARSGGSAPSETRTVTKYIIAVTAPNASWQVARRYSSFRANHAKLAQASPSSHTLPRLPPRQLLRSRAPDPQLVARRMMALDAYLRQLLALPAVAASPTLLRFLGAPESIISSAASAAAPRRRTISPHKPGAPAWGVSTDMEAERHAEAVAHELGLFDATATFARGFNELRFDDQPDAAADATTRFLDDLEERIIAKLCSGGGCGQPAEVAWRARDLLEDRLMGTLHGRVFASRADESEADARLAATLDRLRERLGPEALEVDSRFRDARFNRFDAAQLELRALSDESTPRGKLDCVTRALQQLKHGLVESLVATGQAAVLGADELFPVVVLVLLRASPYRLHSNLLYMSRWRRPSALKAEHGCYLAHLQAAVVFLESLAAAGEHAVADEADGVGTTSELAARATSTIETFEVESSPFEPLGELQYELMELEGVARHVTETSDDDEAEPEPRRPQIDGAQGGFAAHSELSTAEAAIAGVDLVGGVDRVRLDSSLEAVRSN